MAFMRFTRPDLSPAFMGAGSSGGGGKKLNAAAHS